MKRILPLILTAALLTGCGGETEQQAASLDAQTVLLMVDGREVPAWRYLYWLAYTCDYVASQSDGTPDWDGGELADYVKEQALADAVLYATVENWAGAYGCQVTEEDQAAIDAEWETKCADCGGEEAYLAALANMGLDRAGAETLAGDRYLYLHLYDLYCAEDSELYPETAALEDFSREMGYVTVEYMRVSDGDDGQSRAEEAFSRLDASAAPLHDFSVLAAAYGDEGEEIRCTLPPEGGVLPQAVETAAMALEEGQWSGLVEAEGAFYILLRTSPDPEAVRGDYFDALLQAAADSADTTVTADYETLSVAAFYEELTRRRAETAAADTKGSSSS